MLVLVVQRDDDVRAIMLRQFEGRGLAVVVTATLQAAATAAGRQTFDVAIVDMDLAGGVGSEVLDAIGRACPNVHRIVLSSSALESDRLRSIELGADDFIVKPVIVRELASRILAIGRRFRPAADGIVRSSSLEIDLFAGTVVSHGSPVVLTPVEFDLLAFLATRPGIVFAREELLAAVWNTSDVRKLAEVSDTVAGLRRKIEADPRRPQLLRTVRSAGYRFGIQDPDGLDTSVARRSSTSRGNARADGNEAPTPIADSSARLRRLVTGVFSEMAEAVIVTDLQFHIRSWNESAHRLYGWSEPEVIGRHLLDVVPWAIGTNLVDHSWHSIEAKGRWHGHGRQVTRNGREIGVDVSTTLVRDERGEPIGVVSINRPAQVGTGPGTSQVTTDETEIRDGLDNGEFVVYYQPVVNLDDKEVVAFEALVRWNHPRLGVVLPVDFIGVAERSDLIVELGTMVLGEACRQTAEWQRGGANVRVAVNISARELGDPFLVERVDEALNASGLDPRSLWLEVTETVLVEDLEDVSLRLRSLAAIGIGVAIDDFGTGWASLLYLRQFPVRTLKIDRVFVSGVDRKPSDTAIARSVVSLGAELNLSVIAEGVETVAQEVRLRKLGCRFGQGFLYGRPTPAAQAPIERARRAADRVIAEGSLDEHARSPEHRNAASASAISAVSAASVHTLDPSSPVATDFSDDSPVATMLRGLLRIRTTRQAAQLVQRAAVALGGTLVSAGAASGALQLDLSLGDGPPVLVDAELTSPARLRLEQLLPQLVEDARQAVDLLRHRELGEPDRKRTARRM